MKYEELQNMIKEVEIINGFLSPYTDKIVSYSDNLGLQSASMPLNKRLGGIVEDALIREKARIMRKIEELS